MDGCTEKCMARRMLDRQKGAGNQHCLEDKYPPISSRTLGAINTPTHTHTDNHLCHVLDYICVNTNRDRT